MEPKKLSSQELTNDIRTGMSDADLKEKYRLSQNELERVFLKLVEYGAIQQIEMDLRRAIFQKRDEGKVRELDKELNSIQITPTRSAEAKPRTESTPNYASSIFSAARSGSTVGVKELINKGANIEGKDKDGCTPLILAAQNGHREIVELLLQHGAGVDIKDKTAKTAASWAAINGHTELAGILWKLEIQEAQGLRHVPQTSTLRNRIPDRGKQETEKASYQTPKESKFMGPEKNQDMITSNLPQREPDLETLKKEQRIFLFGFIGTVVLAYFLAVLISIDTAQTEREIGIIVIIALISRIYFVGRLSWAMHQPLWLTIVWCILAPLNFFWVIPVIGLLISLKQTKTKLMNAT